MQMTITLISAVLYLFLIFGASENLQMCIEYYCKIFHIHVHVVIIGQSTLVAAPTFLIRCPILPIIVRVSIWPTLVGAIPSGSDPFDISRAVCSVASNSVPSRSRGWSNTSTVDSSLVRSFKDHGSIGVDSNLWWHKEIIIKYNHYLPLGQLWSLPEQAAGPGKVSKRLPEILLKTPWWLPGGRRLTFWRRADDYWMDGILDLLL